MPTRRSFTLAYRYMALAAGSVAALAATAALAAQNGSSTQQIPIPIALVRSVTALGDRISVQGKERVSVEGVVARPGNASSKAAFTFERPDKFRYDDGSQTIVANGRKLWSGKSRTVADSEVIESLFDDTMDGLLASLPSATHFRPLLNRVPITGGPSTVSQVDILEFTLPSLARSGEYRLKRFAFDSGTGLLYKVTYLSEGKRSSRVETTFENWTVTNGNAMPGLISRSIGGKTSFTFTVSQANIGPKQDDQKFQLP